MPTKITLEGKQKIEENIQELMEELKQLRKEKVVAYNLTGDTWHDNPYFNKLEQDERALNTKINEAQEILKNAEIVDSASRNMETVEIGSIVETKNPVFSMLSSVKCRNSQEINDFSTLSDTLFYPLSQNQKYLQSGFHPNPEGYRKSTVRLDNC